VAIYPPFVFAVTATSFDDDDPLAGLSLGEMPEPDPPAGWVVVEVKAAALNHHDLWSLRGVGLSSELLPMILGCDAAGVDEHGNEVVVYPVVFDPRRTLLSELHPGTFAEKVAVPAQNLVPKPPGLSFEEAACLPTAWLTAYRMLFTKARVMPGTTVLVQGAGGGVSTALVVLGKAAGVRVWVTSRSAERRAAALALGADRAFEAGERLPERVDAVMETVGAATWAHSVRSVRDGGTIVVSGATSGEAPPAELRHVFFRELSILGATMGTRDELERLVRSGVRPVVHEAMPLDEAPRGFEALLEGEPVGKIVFTT
jgi:NADPH:quinone reductase-like Zn-dependent oxidoreductase